MKMCVTFSMTLLKLGIYLDMQLLYHGIDNQAHSPILLFIRPICLSFQGKFVS